MTWYAKTAVATVFTRTVISEVMWQAQKVANTAKSGLVDSDKAIVWVPFVTQNGTDRSSSLNFKAGDYLVPESAADVMIDSTFTPTSLLAKYPNAVQVRTVDRKNYGPLSMHHVQLGGK
jgi:hypothetical protein